MAGRKSKTVDGLRPCKICCLTKPTAEFYFHVKRNRFSPYCLKCVRDKQRSYKRKPEVDRRAKLKRFYGLTEADVTNAIQKQNGLCAICQNPLRLVVDHCHKTGRFRGMLCTNCNSLLGHAKDSVSVLYSAIAYLQAQKS